MTEKNLQHWVGPHNMLVDNSIDSVPSPDCVNTCYKEGYETEMNANGIWLDKETYLQNYAHKRPGDDRWWYWPPEERCAQGCGPCGNTCGNK